MTLDTQYHCSIKPISRSAGRSVVAASAYRSGTLLRDARTGLEHNFLRKRGVVLSEIVTPPGCDWALDRERLWNAVEQKTRSNGRAATECQCSLPAALTDAQRATLARAFAAGLAAEGFAVDFAIHAPHPQRRPRGGAAGADLPGDDSRNWHAHILVSHLPISPEGPGKPVSKLFDGPAAVEAIRARWAEHVNAAYAAAGIDARQDHRSYADQGIDRVPTRHLGPAVAALERRGIRTERGEIHRARTEARAEQRRAGIAVAALVGEQQRRAERRQQSAPPASSPSPARPAPPPPQQQEAPTMNKKYSPRGRIQGRGGRPPRRPPQQHEPRQPHEQTDDLRAWLWSQAYGPAEMPRDWLRSTTALWTFGRPGEPPGTHVQLAADAGRLHDDGGTITWSHADVPTAEQRQAAVAALLDLSQARQWSALKVLGDAAFRAEVARLATRRGIEVDEDLRHVVEDERRRMAEQQSATQTSAAGAGPGIAPASPAVVVSVSTAQPSSPTVAAFMAAGRDARAAGVDADDWLSLYAARLTPEQRAEIAAHLATQPDASARWGLATEDAMTAAAAATAQQRGDVKTVRAVVGATPPERRRIVGDLLHERADSAADGEPADLADLRCRGTAQALAREWDRLSAEAERAQPAAARVEESPRPPPTAPEIRAIGERVLAAQRSERDGHGDPLDTLRAERALSTALDRTTLETRRALADPLARDRHPHDPALTALLRVAVAAADDRAARRVSRPDQREEMVQENAVEMEAPRPEFTDA